MQVSVVHWSKCKFTVSYSQLTYQTPRQQFCIKAVEKDRPVIQTAPVAKNEVEFLLTTVHSWCIINKTVWTLTGQSDIILQCFWQWVGLWCVNCTEQQQQQHMHNCEWFCVTNFTSMTAFNPYFNISVKHNGSVIYIKHTLTVKAHVWKVILTLLITKSDKSVAGNYKH